MKGKAHHNVEPPAAKPDAMDAMLDFWARVDERTLGHVETLRAQLARSVAGVMLQGAEVRAVRSGTVSTYISGSAGRLIGYAFRETSGAAVATIDLLDGTDTGGDLVVPIQLAAGESTRDWFGPSGISLVHGLYVSTAAGNIEGAVYLGAVD